MNRVIGLMAMSIVGGALAGCAGYDGSIHAGDEEYVGGDDYDGAPAPRGSDIHAGENYGELVENDWVPTAHEAVSTFSIDVDNGSYTLMRSDIEAGRLPAQAGVRPEEYINYFDYGYPQPREGEPFSIHMEVAPSKFGKELHMLRIGLQGRDVTMENLRPTNLVFLIDTSGSMSSEEKLPLVKESLYALIDNLRETDTIGIVTYAGSSGVVLEPTPVSRANEIKDAINRLESGGSTNGEAGIVSAYRLAEQAKVEGGNNRVVLATDGDFNVGRTNDDLIALIQEYREKHISITTVGYGRGNYNDYMMEGIAREGNGNYFYIDTLDEARRIFGEDLPSTLEVIASDVKIQVEFSADTVKRYRLVGYENRLLENDDFEDDTKDAGEIGPGHTVTALYELEIDPGAASETGLLAEVRLRHKPQFGDESQLQEQGIKLSQIAGSYADASAGFRFATAVAEYAEILRESKHSEGARFTDVIEIATGATGGDDAKAEFVELASRAASINNGQ